MGLLFNRASAGFLVPVNKTVDAVINASNGLMCLATGIFGKGFGVGSIMAGLALIGASLVHSIIGAVKAVVMKHVNKILNSILGPIHAIERQIQDLTKILISVQNILDKATNLDNYFKKRQDCSSRGAEIMNCLAQSAIDGITSKIAKDIDKHLTPISTRVATDSFKATGSINSYVKRNSDFLKKASLQNKLLT